VEGLIGQPGIGTVKWFNNEKGYGFITRDDGRDFFVHHSEILTSGYRTLEAGQRVDFRVAQGPRGDRATDVIVVGEE
jgi:CspA family cold shock protein